MRDFVARLAIFTAVILGGMGIVITFIPGAEANWFGFAALVASIGVVATKTQIRLTAIALVIGLGIWALDGYFRGVRYREALRQRQESKPTTP